MRRVLNVVLLALVMMVMPGMALGQEETDPMSDATGAGEVSDDAASGEEGGDIFQSRIVVKSQKKKKAFSDKIVVVQRKPFMRRNRVELAPMFYGGINDSLLFQVGVGGQINYHILEWLYVGVYGGWQDWRFVDRRSNSLSESYDDVIDAEYTKE